MKKIDISAVVFVDTCFSLFIVLLQMPAYYLVGKIGIKKGMILGNICNAIYLIVVINSTNIMASICRAGIRIGIFFKKYCRTSNVEWFN